MKQRAKIQILAHIFQFNILNGIDGFKGSALDEQSHIPIGSLVAPFCAPNTKYYLSWLRDIKLDENGWHKFLLESIEDGELCWWENISFHYLPLEYTDKFPEWKWTDKQYDFNDKWQRVDFKFKFRALLPIFDNNDNSVILKFRYGYGISDDIPERKFDNWKKLTKREMQSFVDEIYANSSKK